MDKQAYLDRWYELNAVVHAIVTSKRDLLPTVKDPVALEAMRTLKKALDPQGY